jgi:protein arginine kinase activator
MKCDLCNKPAVVHEVQITNGVKRELHLCLEHAAQQGFASLSPLTMQAVSTRVGSAAVQSPRCPECDMTFAQIQQGPHLGCPTCFDVFDTAVAQLIEEAQFGGRRHVGRRPAGAQTDLAARHESQRLMRELEAAVSAEQYERAAEIRDQLARRSRQDSGIGSSEDA